MDLVELSSLIKIREYINNAIGSYSIERNTVNYLNGALLLIDKKIVELLQKDEFKSYINYKDVRKAIEEVVKLNDIKSGIRHKL
jgi:hypothetical protein